MKRFAAAILLLLILFALTGCMENAITEDSVREALPGVDPSSLPNQNTQVSLYFRVTGQETLFPYSVTLEARNESSLASVALERLLLDPSADQTYLSAPFPKGTRLISARKETDGTYTVTMSKELLEPNPEASTKTARDTDLRLRAYAIVNTICSFSPDSRVQILIDTNNTGRGNRISPFLMGFASHSEWLEPLTMDETHTITPGMLLEVTLDYLIDADYENAYLFFSDYGAGMQKPELDEFQASLESLGRIRSYSLLDITTETPGTPGYALLNISYIDAAGHEVFLQNVTIHLVTEEALWKVSYQSLLNVLGAAK